MSEDQSRKHRVRILAQRMNRIISGKPVGEVLQALQYVAADQLTNVGKDLRHSYEIGAKFGSSLLDVVEAVHLEKSKGGARG